MLNRSSAALALVYVLGLGGCGEQATPPPPAAQPGAQAPAKSREKAPPMWAKVATAQVDEARRLGIAVAYEDEKTGLRFVLIPGGTSQIGAGAGEGEPDERPKHAVTLSSFYLSIYETTNVQYRRFRDQHKGQFREGDQPVERVSHADAIAFAQWLNGQGSTKDYSLPTEAQWEHACRAGSTTRWSFGDDESSLGEHAWYRENSGSQPHRVGERKANAWGLHDMHGNVAEWCADADALEFYGTAEATKPDPMNAEAAPTHRVFRGGSWNDAPVHCRSANRNRMPPEERVGYLGFRLARPATAR